MTCPTIEDLAAAVKNEEMDFDDALLMHLEHRHSEYHTIEAFFVLSMAIGYVSSGHPATTLELSGEEASAFDWVQKFGLGPFVE